MPKMLGNKFSDSITFRGAGLRRLALQTLCPMFR